MGSNPKTERTAVRLSRIVVENHSRISNLDIRVDNHLVIVGANDVGKTSLLRLLNLLLGSSTAQLYATLGQGDLRDQGKPLLVSASLVDFEDSDRTLFHREIDINPADKSESLVVRLEVTIDPDDDDSVVINRWSPGRGEVRALTREQLDAFGWRYLTASRGTSAALLDGTNGAIPVLLRAVQDELGDERETFGTLLQTFNEKLGASEALTGLRESIAKHLSSSMPRSVKTGDLWIRTTADPDESVLENVSLYMAQPDSTFTPLSEQSDGIRQLMTMTLFDLAQGAANVIAIDEPELHLHPLSQRTVARLLQTRTTQKVLVTHSPYVVQRFDPTEVVAVSPDGRCAQIDPAKFTVNERTQAHWWSPKMLEALTARIAILVEGVADRIVVEAAAAARGVSLDQIGAMVFELGGAENFRTVYKLLGPEGFGVEVLGLVDDAESPAWVGAVGGIPAKVIGTTVFISTADLEEEYCRGIGPAETAQRLIAQGVGNETGILASCGVSALADINSADLAAFCRGKSGSGIGRKVPAAIAIQNTLTAADVATLTSISTLLNRVEDLTR